MKRWAVIGIGSTLHRDDALGFHMAEMLLEKLGDTDSIEISAAIQITPEMAADIAEADRVLFIDAFTEGTPGEIHMDPLEADPSADISSHFQSPGSLLANCKLLYGSVPSAFLAGITGEQFDLGEGYSDPVAASIPVLLDRILHLLTSPEG